MFKELGLYYRTIKHLKPIQIRYRLYYTLRSNIRNLTRHTYPLSISKQGKSLNLRPGIPKHSTFNLQPTTTTSTSKTEFTFLNQSHAFQEAIDWNIDRYGKLWAYNLNYFDYLHQPGITREQGLRLIHDFIQQMDTNREGLEPYPISLRGINWIRFLARHEIQDTHIDASLYAQYQILLDNLEYHLLGNHLLENGCSLLFGAYYFRDEELMNTAGEILTEQLEEQILSDGAHFERSTMYNAILLERLLDCYNLVSNNRWGAANDLENKVKEKLEPMLGWLERMTVDRPATSDAPSTAVRRPSSVAKDLPLLNDAAKGIAPNPHELLEYADRLGLAANEIVLGESGYRRYSTGTLDLICDVGSIGPDYQPGHAHSDTLSFVLYHEGKPLIVDPGISTYENNQRRHLERSTRFHNTVEVEGKEQSEVWSAFRVGRRANVAIQVDEEDELAATHDGYRPWGIRHKRKWKMEEGTIAIVDRLSGIDSVQGIFFLHVHPRWLGKVHVEDNLVQVNDISIEFENPQKIKQYPYDCPDGYNQYIKAPKIEVLFTNELRSRIFVEHGGHTG